MKKRLLITSIVMMLVVAVALSTATYAWFTSNATVSASTVSLTAATNTASSIGISWQNSGYGTSITAGGPSAVSFDPMAPSALTAGSTSITAPTAAGGVDFWSGNIKQEGGVDTFNTAGIKHWGAAAAGDQVAPYVWQDTSGTYKSFFLKNLSDTKDITGVTLTASVEGQGADLIRIAVFARIGSTANTAPSGSYVLKKVLSNGVFTYTPASTYSDSAVYYAGNTNGSAIVTIASQEALTQYNEAEGQQAYTRTVSTAAEGTAYCTSGSITAGSVAEKISSNTTDNAVSVNLGALNANCIAELIVYVWTDGTALVDARGGNTASITLDVTTA